MKTLSSDTHPDAERFHIELLRKAPVFKRLGMVASLVKTTYQLSWMGLCERYPNEPAEKRMERFVYYLYGDRDLASRVMSHFAHIKRDDEVSK